MLYAQIDENQFKTYFYYYLSKMNTIPEKDKKIMNELFLLQDSLQEFTNPISKNTFEALPRIYGKKKKKKYIIDYPYTSKAAEQNKISMFRAQKFMNNNGKEEEKIETMRQKQMDDRANTKRYQTQIKRHNKQAVEKMSKPRQQFCGKRYCFCNKQHRKALLQSGSKSSLKARNIRGLSLKLPQLNRSAQPDDVQSKHKVTMQKRFLSDKQGNSRPYTLFDLLRNNQKNSPSRIDNSSLDKNEESQQEKFKVKKNKYEVSVQTQFDDYQEENMQEKMHTLPNETIFISPRKNTKKQLGIQTKNNQIQLSDEDNPNHKRETQKQLANSQSGLVKQSVEIDNNNDLDTPRQNFLRLKEAYKDNRSEPSSDNQDSRSIASSVSSATISKHIFDKVKNPNTVFHKLNSQQTRSNIKRSRVKSEKLNSQDLENNSKPKQKYKYQKKNGLFVIPQQQEYVNYLKDYESMSHKTKIKDLIQKQGFRVIKSSEGVYFGEMENDEKHGKGIMVTQKNIFEGKYDRDVKTSGYEKNIDGIYKGQFMNGKREGYGSFQWYNGQSFEGQWENGTKNGYGVWKSPKGDFYEGQWKLNRQHGKGTYKHRMSTYRGYFVDFLKDGNGQQIFSNGDKYVGIYKQGKPHGKGKYQWADGSYYEGDFVKGVREGKGVWKFKNGTVYEGEFKNDFKNGKGKQSYKGGEMFDGTFFEGEKLEGVLYDTNGNTVFIKNET